MRVRLASIIALVVWVAVAAPAWAAMAVAGCEGKLAAFATPSLKTLADVNVVKRGWVPQPRDGCAIEAILPVANPARLALLVSASADEDADGKRRFDILILDADRLGLTRRIALRPALAETPNLAVAPDGSVALVAFEDDPRQGIATVGLAGPAREEVALQAGTSPAWFEEGSVALDRDTVLTQQDLLRRTANGWVKVRLARPPGDWPGQAVTRAGILLFPDHAENHAMALTKPDGTTEMLPALRGVGDLRKLVPAPGGHAIALLTRAGRGMLAPLPAQASPPPASGVFDDILCAGDTGAVFRHGRTATMVTTSAHATVPQAVDADTRCVFLP